MTNQTDRQMSIAISAPIVLGLVASAFVLLISTIARHFL